jgi:hypothetical protein
MDTMEQNRTLYEDNSNHTLVYKTQMQQNKSTMECDDNLSHKILDKSSRTLAATGAINSRYCTQRATKREDDGEITAATLFVLVLNHRTNRG